MLQESSFEKVRISYVTTLPYATIIDHKACIRRVNNAYNRASCATNSVIVLHANRIVVQVYPIQG